MSWSWSARTWWCGYRVPDHNRTEPRCRQSAPHRWRYGWTNVFLIMTWILEFRGMRCGVPDGAEQISGWSFRSFSPSSKWSASVSRLRPWLWSLIVVSLVRILGDDDASRSAHACGEPGRRPSVCAVSSVDDVVVASSAAAAPSSFASSWSKKKTARRRRRSSWRRPFPPRLRF